MSGSSGSSGDPFANLTDEEWEHLSDEQLVSRLLVCGNGYKQQVRRAWEKLYSRHAQRILRYLYHLSSRSQLQNVPEIARELMDTTFNNAFVDLVTRKQPDNFTRPGSSFKAWIDIIARNEFYEYVKRLGRYASLDAIIEKREEGQMVSSAEEDPVQPSENIERHLAIEEAVSKLPDREAEVFKLVFFEQMTVKQIAIKLNLSDKAVQQALFRARKRFKKLYAGPRPASSKRQKAKRRSPSKAKTTRQQTEEPE